MRVNPAELEERMSRKSADELRAILDAPEEQYSPEARAAAATALERTPSTDHVADAAVESAPRASVMARIATIVTALLVGRELVRLLTRLLR